MLVICVPVTYNCKYWIHCIYRKWGQWSKHFSDINLLGKKWCLLIMIIMISMIITTMIIKITLPCVNKRYQNHCQTSFYQLITGYNLNVHVISMSVTCTGSYWIQVYILQVKTMKQTFQRDWLARREVVCADDDVLFKEGFLHHRNSLRNWLNTIEMKLHFHTINIYFF